MIGKSVSHYNILKELGGGGMGVVYKAWDTKLERTVALKFLPPELTRDPTAKSRFIQEAKAASSIQHQNICTIHDIDETVDGHMFICMDCYEGETLKEIIERGPAMIEESVNVAIQIGHGLSRAHEAGIVHRDLKPANIMITERNEVKIVDFGLAMLIGLTRLTRTGTTVGTTAYMSPEQARGDVVDKRSDIWSLGVILYEMLTGQLPFRGAYEPAVIYSILNDEPRPPRSLRSDIPYSLENLVLKLLRKNSDDRFQSVTEVVTALTGILNEIETGTVDKHVITFKISRVKKWYKTAAVVLVLIIAAVVYLMLSSGRSGRISAIAILPFKNTSGNSAIDYLSDGFTEDLINSLSGASNLRLISFHSVLKYRGSLTDVSAIGGELNVQAVVSGSISKTGEKLQIGVVLIRVEDGKKLWGSEYSENVSEIFRIEKEIRENLDREIGTEYKTGRKPDIYSTRNLESYDLYLRGRILTENYKKPDNMLAISYFEQALEKDSIFIPVYVALANANLMMIEWKWDTDKNRLSKAEEYCRRALAIDSTVSGAYSVLGRVMLYNGKREEGFKLLERSIELNPNSAASYSMLGKEFLFTEYKPAKGLTYLIRAQEIEPNNFVTVMNVGIGHAMMREYNSAIRSFHQAIKLDSTQETPRLNLAVGYEHIGLYDSAALAYESALKLNPKDAEIYEYLGSIYVGKGEVQKALNTFNTGLRLSSTKYRLLYLLGTAHSILNDNSGARLKWIEGRDLTDGLSKDENIGPEPQFYLALFHARLGNVQSAVKIAESAYRTDSLNAESAFYLARVYAVIKNKELLKKFFEKAKELSPDYDESALSTEVDFHPFKNETDLLAIARRQ